MNILELQSYCMSKENVSIAYLNDQILTFNIFDKVFCYCYINNNPLNIILKSDPFISQTLRAKYPEIKEGFKMNENTWNTITLSHSLASSLIEELIDQSYDLIDDAIQPSVKTPIVRKQVAFASV